ncbi:phosphoribosyltransferase family protein [Pedobacter sp. PF22-3]|uniref:ComF family protein n=1 Tax=Pedobacter sp. PF22-3 TaxID=2994467 RepID=UPI0022479C8B|nr:phosphoribosyltransferase family protein [Pedobacter sp. PF22-3]MCX2494134.1 phosphoribosyltransferase family protein [Pedobacter sp. PF22-3]
MLQVKQWCNDLIGLLFPNLCNACGVALYQSEHLICTKCLYDLPFTDYHQYAENRVAKQLWGRLPLHAAMAMLYFRKGAKVQNLIHNLKYNGRTDVGVLLGNMLGERLKSANLYQDIDLVIPVPLHRKKYKTRGYNQSTFIAEGIAAQLEIGISEDHLIRNTSTESQTKKSRYNRYENMKDVFQVNYPEDIIGKHILLVDDVITTGATLEACAITLLDIGAAKVSIAAIAFAE